MADLTKRKWIPNLTGRVDSIVEQAIRFLFEAVYDLRDGKAGPGSLPSSNEKSAKVVGTSMTVNFPGGFLGPNATTYYNMDFVDGVLVRTR